MSDQVYTTEQLNSVLRRLTSAQLQFVAARLYTDTDAEAAEAIGVPAAIVYNWPNKALVNEAVTMTNAVYIKPVAQDLLHRLVVPAIMRLGEIIADPEAHNRDVLRAISDVLDRSDITKKSMVESRVTQEVSFTSEALRRAADQVAALERELLADDDDSDGDGGDA